MRPFFSEFQWFLRAFVMCFNFFKHYESTDIAVGSHVVM